MANTASLIASLKKLIADYRPRAAEDVAAAQLQQMLNQLKHWREQAQDSHWQELSQAAAENPLLAPLLYGLALDGTKQKNYWSLLLKCLPPLPLAEEHSLWLSLEYLALSNSGICNTADYVLDWRRDLQTRYNDIAKNALAQMPAPPQKSAHKTILLLLRLWRNPKHYAPAAEALLYATELRRQGYEVVLVNCNLLAQNMPVPFWPPSRFAPLPDAASETIDYNGQHFRLLHRLGGPLHDDAAFVQQLKTMGASAALSLGDGNIYADWLSQSWPVLVLPYSIYPAIQYKAAIAAHRPSSIGFENYVDAFLPTAPAIWLEPNARTTPANAAITRQQINLPPHAPIIAIVGARLHSELSTNFLAMLEQLALAMPQLRFLFIGRFEHAAQILQPYPALTHCAKVQAAPEPLANIWAIVDLYLNPPRAGGGFSIASALSAGVPCLSLVQGDGSAIIDAQSRCTSLADMQQKALSLLQNKTSHQQACLAAQARAAALANYQPNCLKVCTYLEEHAK